MQKSPAAYLISTLVTSTVFGTIISAMSVAIWQGFLSPQFRAAVTLDSAEVVVAPAQRQI
ncbi:MAG: hypothetical protein HC866_26815 [Leptolyngbyaceae cyanobacterium RU_5_1]|nr:hypothetical protein [Leptolyngbyaceae cyanobacterium RU_5_1]